MKELEAIKARVKEMEEEAEKLKEMQKQVEESIMSPTVGQSTCKIQLDFSFPPPSPHFLKTGMSGYECLIGRTLKVVHSVLEDCYQVRVLCYNERNLLSPIRIGKMVNFELIFL